jgi:tetratricopeptide (TPR) repeat protein
VNPTEPLAEALRQHQAGQWTEAERLYRQVLQADPNNANACHMLGILCTQAGNHAQAVEYIERALRQHPQSPVLLANLGLAHHGLGKLDAAASSLEQALRLQPAYAEAHYNLGLVRASQGQLEEAAACYRQALRLRPDFVMACNNLGNVCHEQGKLAEAETCFREVLQRQPALAVAHNNLGNVLRDQGTFGDAEACYRAAIHWQGDYARAHYNLGVALADQDRFAEAIAAYTQALRLDPNLAGAHYNLGVVHADQGRLEEAVASYEQAIKRWPDFAEARWNRALAWLVQGNFAQGWREYEWRWRKKDTPPRLFSQPRWDGSSLHGKTILLYAEQGLGDTLQFARYTSLVRKRGGRVLLECQPALVPLLRNLPDIDRLFAKGEALPAFDVQAPLLSLPAILQTDLAAIPAQVPYLHPDPDRVAMWRQRLRDQEDRDQAALTPDPRFPTPLLVGIAWQGNPRHRGDRSRSLRLAEFALLARALRELTPPAQLVTLQKGFGSEQVADFAREFAILDWTSEMDEKAGAFVDTAALMKSLDLVITSDTAIAHLAGALGVPVWLALAAVADWRWLLNREDSPWYPTMRLFRQPRAGDWASVVERMAAEIGTYGTAVSSNYAAPRSTSPCSSADGCSS